jgi:hypothetical protein
MIYYVLVLCSTVHSGTVCNTSRFETQNICQFMYRQARDIARGQYNGALPIGRCIRVELKK